MFDIFRELWASVYAKNRLKRWFIWNIWNRKIYISRRAHPITSPHTHLIIAHTLLIPTLPHTFFTCLKLWNRTRSKSSFILVDVVLCVEQYRDYTHFSFLFFLLCVCIEFAWSGCPSTVVIVIIFAFWIKWQCDNANLSSSSFVITQITHKYTTLRFIYCASCVWLIYYFINFAIADFQRHVARYLVYETKFGVHHSFIRDFGQMMS